ncbi:MAG: hypothetical protein JW958_02645 [Candidatus Eisenbacteria bacterium]|nr:hypothetical protein [Candidatus Eisenbacteria bacterium]
MRRVLALLAFLALVPAAGAGPSPGAADPLAVFEDVAEAWRSGDPARIAPHLGRRGLRLSFAGRAPEGRYSANQALFLLEDLLREPGTVRFAFLRYRNLDGGEGRPSGVAERIRLGADGAPEREMVFISLVREEGRWMLAEMKGTPGPEPGPKAPRSS